MPQLRDTRDTLRRDHAELRELIPNRLRALAHQEITPRSRRSAYVRAWVLRLRGILSPLAISVGQMLPSAYEKTSTSRMSLFRCSIALPARAPVNA